MVAAAAAAAGEAVLLSSTAPGYAPGMVVAANERLTVPEGASATLLFQSGEMLRLRGPFDGPLYTTEARNANKGSIAALAEILRLHGIDAAVVGGTRGVDTLSRSRVIDSDLVVDARRSATYCIERSTSIWIGRPDEALDRIALRRRGGSREIAWPAGATRVEWPADMLVEDGDRFEIADPAGNPRAVVIFHVVEERGLSVAARVARAALAGCHDQIAVSLRELGRAGMPRELFLSSDRGREPTYRVGEAMRVVMQSNVDGFLYCVHQRSDGSAVPVFPSSAVDGARLRSHETLSIPGQRRMGELTAGPPGVSRITCYFADRDIAPEIPHALLSDSAAQLPDGLASRLDDVFGAVGGTRLLKASLTIRVE